MPSDDERRLHERYRAWLPAQIGGESVEMQLAIGHDMSQGGALLVTRSELEIGASITLEVQVPPGAVPGSTIFAQVPQAPGPVQGAVVQAVQAVPGGVELCAKQ